MPPLNAKDLNSLVRQLSGRDPEAALGAVVALRSHLDQVERAQVAAARRQGWSWQDIATVLGKSKQTVFEKHR